jgi:hypothetical protein
MSHSIYTHFHKWQKKMGHFTEEAGDMVFPKRMENKNQFIARCELKTMKNCTKVLYTLYNLTNPTAV